MSLDINHNQPTNQPTLESSKKKLFILIAIAKKTIKKLIFCC